MKDNYLLRKKVTRTILFVLLLTAVGMTKAMAQTYTNTLESTLTSTPINAKTVGVIPYSDDFITQEEVMEWNYAITSFRMIDTATVAVLSGASDMILVYSLNQNQILYKIQLPISARAFDYDNGLFHVIGDRTYLSIDAEGMIHERKDFQQPQLPNEEIFIITDLKIIDGQPIIHECNANTYSINSDGLQKIDTFFYDHARSCKIYPKYIDENSFLLYNETPSRSGRSNVLMESLGLEGKLACLNPISVNDDYIAINLQTTYNCTGSFVKSYLLVVNPNGELINLIEAPINYLSYISKPFCYKDNAWYYAFSGQGGISIFKIGTNTNRIDRPDSFILSDYSYREPENEAFHEDTSSDSLTRGSMNGWRTITQTWYNGNQYRTLEWTPIAENIVYNCTWIEGTGYRPGYIKTPAYITTQPNAIKMGVPYKRAGFTRWQDFKNLAGLGRKTGNCYHPDNSTCSGECYWEATDAYVIGVDCSGFVSSCWEFSYAEGTYNIPNYCTFHGNVTTASESDFQKGDALNWAGHHVMLYTGHTASTHRIAVFESTSTGGVWRTVANDYDASYFSQYDYKIQRLNLMKNIILRLNQAITMSQNGSTVTTVTQGQPLTVNYRVKNFGNETWEGYVSLFIEQSNGNLQRIGEEYYTTLVPNDWQSFTFSNNEVISPVGTTKFYVKVKNYNAGGDNAYYDVGGGEFTNPLVFEIVEGGGGGCSDCPDYDESWNVNNAGAGEWTYKSSSIGSGECRIYRIPLLSSCTYTFQTGCDHGTASFDTQLYLFDASCNQVAYDDDGCPNYLSSIEYTNTGSNAYYYLKIKGYGSSSGSYTIAAKREGGDTPCSECPDYDESWSITGEGEWTTKSASIDADGCRIYRVPLLPSYTYTFQTCGEGTANFDTRLYLYDASCNEVANDDDGCTGNLSLLEYTNTGNAAYYYLKIDGYNGAGGSYTIAAKREGGSSPCVDCPDYNESWNINNAMVGEWTYTSSSIGSGECRIYRVPLASSYTYTFQTGCDNGTATFDTQMYLFDASCDQVAYDDDGCPNFLSSIEYTNTGSTAYFYLKIKGYGSSSGSYTIAAKRESPSTTFVIDVSANPSVGGMVSGAGSYNNGSTCTLTATANTGYTFTNWTKNGAVVSTNATYSFTVTENANYVANFTLNTYQITASANPNNGGMVSGDGTYNYGATCTVTATANEGYTFSNWTKNGAVVSTNATYNFTVTESATYVANFSQDNYTISASSSPSNGGTVSGGGTYNYGATCTLTATANTGYTFVNWTENGTQVSTEANYSFTVSDDRNLVANFATPFTITVNVTPSEGGTVAGTGTYNYGSTCTLTATPNQGYLFLNWSRNGEVVCVNASYNFTVTENVDLLASFMLLNGTLVGSGEATNVYLPSYSYYNYTLSQQIYSSSEIGEAGNITSLSFYNAGTEKTRNYDIYMVHTDKSAFDSNSDWITVTESDLVYSGNVTMTRGCWTAIELDTEFAYNGTSNLAIIVDDNSGNWSGNSMACRVFDASGNQAIRVYSDGTNYDPYNPSSYNGTLYSVKNQIIINKSAYYYNIIAESSNADAGTVSGSGWYPSGSTCTLLATANTGYTFTNWTKNGAVVSTNATYSFTVTENASYVANFTLNTYQITALANPSNGGTVSGDGTYNYGATCTVTATANEGYMFVNWTENGSVVSTNASYSFIVSDNRTLVANFTVIPISYTVLVSANPTYSGMVSGGGSYQQGSICTVTATPNEGYVFVNWTENGEVVSTMATYSFTVSTNRTLLANFSSTTLEHHWTFDPHQFADNMNILGLVAVNGEVLNSEYIEVGAFCGNDCRGSELLIQVDDQYYALMTIVGEAGDLITFRAYDHQVEQEIEGTCTFTVEFEANALIGVPPDNPVVLDFVTVVNITQTTTFNNGWTWWSSYIETANNNVLDQLKSGLGINGQIIKSQVQSTMHMGNNWIGTLNMTNEGGYMVKANAEVAVDITGPATSPASHPISLNSGWTWIGYPNTESMSVGAALANLTPQIGDILKGQSTSAMYMMGQWHGSLILTPGIGLMYMSGNSEVVTFTYAVPTRMTEVETTLVETHWNANYNDYPTNMTVLAVVELDGEEVNSENYELAAFANSECRGSVGMMNVEQLNRHFALLTISGEEPAELHFALYNTESGEEFHNADETMTYETDAVVGSQDEPFVVRFRGNLDLDDWTDNLQIFPNPVERGQSIVLSLSAEEMGEIQVEVINALGMVETVSTPSQQRIYAPKVSGVYTLRITVEGKGTCYRRLIVR